MAPKASPLTKLRTLCLAFPQAHEVGAWGEPTFRVKKGKMFATYAAAGNHHGAGRPAVWIKNVPSNQELLIASQPGRIFKPAYVGPFGWIGVYLDQRVSWRQVNALLADGWRMAAPKSVLKKVKAKT